MPEQMSAVGRATHVQLAPINPRTLVGAGAAALLAVVLAVLLRRQSPPTPAIVLAAASAGWGGANLLALSGGGGVGPRPAGRRSIPTGADRRRVRAGDRGCGREPATWWSAAWRRRCCPERLGCSRSWLGILFCYSRGAWLNVAVAVVIMISVTPLRRRSAPAATRLLALVLGAMACATAAVVLTGSGGFLQERAHLQRYDSSRFGAQRAACPHDPGARDARLGRPQRRARSRHLRHRFGGAARRLVRAAR